MAAIAVAVRVPPAIDYPLWQDEVASARIMVEPTFGSALDRVTETESTPPLWYALAWGIEHASLPVAAARGIGVAAGALLAGLVVLYGRRFLPLWAAGLAGLATALAGQLVLRGAELRVYALYALLALAFAWLLERAAADPRRGRLVALAVATAAGLLTHYFFVFVVIAGLVWLWTGRAREARRRVTAATAVGVVPLLVWTPWFAEQVGNQRYAWIGAFSLLKAVAVYSTFAWNAGPLYVREVVDLDAVDAVLRVGVFVLVLFGCVALWRLGERARLAVLLAVGPVLLAAILWVAGENLFTTRNLIASAPFAALALAAAAAALPGRWGPATGLALLAVVVAGLVREHQLAPPPYDRMAAALVALGWRDGDQLAIFPGAHELTYYGSAYAVRGPVSWYLPGHPELRLAAGQACEEAFALVPAGKAPTSIQQVKDRRAVDGVSVLRLACPEGFEQQVRREGGFVFAQRP